MKHLQEMLLLVEGPHEARMTKYYWDNVDTHEPGVLDRLMDMVVVHKMTPADHAVIMDAIDVLGIKTHMDEMTSSEMIHLVMTACRDKKIRNLSSHQVSELVDKLLDIFEKHPEIFKSDAAAKAALKAKDEADKKKNEESSKKWREREERKTERIRNPTEENIAAAEKEAHSNGGLPPPANAAERDKRLKKWKMSLRDYMLFIHSSSYLHQASGPDPGYRPYRSWLGNGERGKPVKLYP